MKRMVDVVNFNADASCLSSSSWLAMLQNGDGSLMVQWLRLYVKYGKKVTLGFPGSTVADIVIHNPEAINLINSHPDIFEIVLRPFAHDIALLRLGKGFAVNFESGCRVIMNEFCQVTPWFLPPEFMLTNGTGLLLTHWRGCSSHGGMARARFFYQTAWHEKPAGWNRKRKKLSVA